LFAIFDQSVIEPYMFPERRRTFELTMVSFLEKTNQSMNQLQATLERVNAALEAEQRASTSLQASVRELKAELGSVKSLFLNRSAAVSRRYHESF
jgi:septal ring factor EnvC (AmiA/AmiB activator)